MKLISLQTKTTDNFKTNYKHLKELITSCEEGSFILAPELCLTGFCYERMDAADEFTQKTKKKIKKLSENKTIAITFLEKEDIDYYNTLYIFHKGKVIHRQSKHRLFPLGNEPENFAKGKKENMKIIDVDGIKVASLICFEIRFPEYWLNVLGADLILNPSMWGVKRKNHFETMTKALAVANQCYVLTANSANEDMAKGSGIITPWGEEIRDDEEEIISHNMDLSEVKKMRKYIDIGLKKKWK
ncbi:carbon-nitrogen hydrolase family protein [Halarcobacter anaerophilus]|uniref:Carbon-nitrogen hydrolase family protein n=1 Tax=Halarcobacter anaerophilus TaxID=877500 RepID=A0A4Q0Y440_9BACT|nr:carbon-nitrogen hydrolase family protein [Halarcobacter anaerophilus]QDF27645.1 carbon-nitrogen hydrolase family protein [Halarcobacter anaerophilus]RXJ63994.1 carbon-nitrogen hydrolase family protein [Halarcobacter anaerophilus]